MSDLLDLQVQAKYGHTWHWMSYLVPLYNTNQTKPTQTFSKKNAPI